VTGSGPSSDAAPLLPSVPRLAGTWARDRDGPPAQLLTIGEAAGYLNVPRSWLRDRVTAHLVPHTRLGRHVRFSPEHLAQIVAHGEQVVAQQPLPAVTSRPRQRA
jgi:excisionase family DNA binding protein